MTMEQGLLDPAAVGVGDSPGSPFGIANTLFGFAIILFFFGSFATWSVSVPIEGSVVASGVVRVDTNVRTVQHLEGGIVDQILIREGDRVEANQILIRLEDTLPGSTLNEVQAQYFEALALEARLLAERDGSEQVTFPSELTDKIGDKAAQDAIAGQESIFVSRSSLLQEQFSILERTREGLESEIEGLQGQIEAGERQLAIVEEELATVTRLFEQQLVDRPRVLALERSKAELEGGNAQYRAQIGEARQRVEEARLRVAELEATRANEIEEELRTVRARVYELGQRLSAARNVVDRTAIRAPVAGIVVGLNVHTVGGVIAAGERLLDIVPVNDRLIVQAAIDPLDIDQVAVGLPAKVWLSAVNRRTHLAIDGEVTMVSADRVIDPQTGVAFYMVRVEFDGEAAQQNDVPLQAGMSAEVMINTGARTTWDYISAPIGRFLSRALREE